MRQASHRQASETRWRFAADPAVARPPATLSRTIATCREPVSRQTKAPPARSPLRPPQTTCPNPHSESRRRHRSTSRGFLPCRVPDAGPGARGISDEGRHPEPSTESDKRAILMIGHRDQKAAVSRKLLLSHTATAVSARARPNRSGVREQSARRSGCGRLQHAARTHPFDS